MRRSWVRTSLVIAMLGVAAASGYQLIFFEQLIKQEQEAERLFSALGGELTTSISELRANQQAYVAVGQDPSHWMELVTKQLDKVGINLATLARLATAAPTIGSLENAQVAINHLAQVDRRAREHSDVGQDLIASDLLFADGPELALIAINHIGLALETERDATDAVQTNHRKSQGIALATAMGTSVLVALLLLPSSNRPPARSVGVADRTVDETGRVFLQDLEESSGNRDQENTDDTSLQNETTATTTLSSNLDLQLAADLCTELGQLSSPSQLKVILARTAQVFNASGIIVWSLDVNSHSLRPAVGHGYSEATLVKLGTVSCDDDNATAVTFRDKQMHIVPAESTALGAITVPIISMSGCIGVLSLELKDGWELNETVQATAVILSAQLSTLVVPDPAIKTASTEVAQA
tara:strand:- start:3370 stop:4602 length:1233 start_codon:yes stop_codon:yes gene_type:complete